MDGGLDVLRTFRDTVLAKFGAGRAFTRWYYDDSRVAIEFLAAHPVAMPFARAALWTMLVVLEYPLSIALGVAALAALRKRNSIAKVLGVSSGRLEPARVGV